ncbi:hypothetical protein N7468_008398 [Penicillium chermesinum]|uniref:Uncharacterized protein n=1 Tax=Penicillium chermesinum TaxID=63820 RepID=A0A9W9NPZ8_9EURO|nr:uncharacterized protein N7468_008398 [Penicillium chermesinum]KAJ5223856.1 hypothetical protein N7468_008398 [Penicillium chermesinum]
MVIAIKASQDSPQVVLERSELVDQRKKRFQVVTVNKGGNGQLYIQDQPLIISFEKLFLRPSSIPKEVDLSLDKESLKEIAEDIGETQDF